MDHVEEIRRYHERMRCPEALAHGPLDGSGRCPWCRKRVDRAVPARQTGWHQPSELTVAYGQHYDPDHDALTVEQVRARYRMGQEL